MVSNVQTKLFYSWLIVLNSIENERFRVTSLRTLFLIVKLTAYINYWLQTKVGISTLRLLYVKKSKNALKIEESMGMPQIIRNTQKKSLTEIETVIGGTCVELADWRVIILKKKIKGDRQASIIDVLSLEII